MSTLRIIKKCPTTISSRGCILLTRRERSNLAGSYDALAYDENICVDNYPSDVRWSWNYRPNLYLDLEAKELIRYEEN